MNNKVYFLSTGRCATNLFAKAVSASMGNEATIRHQGRFARLHNILANAVWGSPHLFKVVSWSIWRKLPQSTTDPLISVRIALTLLNRKNIAQDIKVIQIVRDPDVIIHSYLRWMRMRKRRWFLHNNVIFWHAHPNLLEDVCKPYFSHSVVDRLTATWTLKNRLFQQVVARYSGIIIRVEDLQSSTGRLKIAEKLVEFLDLQIQPADLSAKLEQRVNASSRTSDILDEDKYSDWLQKFIEETRHDLDYDSHN